MFELLGLSIELLFTSICRRCIVAMLCNGLTHSYQVSLTQIQMLRKQLHILGIFQ